MTIVVTPAEYYPDPTVGRPVFFGQIFVGVPDEDPELIANRVDVDLTQEDGTVVTIAPAGQPFLTGAGGVILFDGSPIRQMTVTGSSYAIKVLNQGNEQVYFQDNVTGASGGGSGSGFDFDTVALAVANTTIVLDALVTTKGYTSIYDGGGNDYDVVAAATGVPDGGLFINLPNTTPPLQLRALFPGNVTNPTQWGAVADGSIDGNGTTPNQTEINAMAVYGGANDIEMQIIHTHFITNTVIFPANSKVRFIKKTSGFSANALFTFAAAGMVTLTTGSSGQDILGMNIFEFQVQTETNRASLLQFPPALTATNVADVRVDKTTLSNCRQGFSINGTAENCDYGDIEQCIFDLGTVVNVTSPSFRIGDITETLLGINSGSTLEGIYQAGDSSQVQLNLVACLDANIGNITLRFGQIITTAAAVASIGNIIANDNFSRLTLDGELNIDSLNSTVKVVGDFAIKTLGGKVNIGNLILTEENVYTSTIPIISADVGDLVIGNIQATTINAATRLIGKSDNTAADGNVTIGDGVITGPPTLQMSVNLIDMGDGLLNITARAPGRAFANESFIIGLATNIGHYVNIQADNWGVSIPVGTDGASLQNTNIILADSVFRDAEVGAVPGGITGGRVVCAVHDYEWRGVLSGGTLTFNHNLGAGFDPSDNVQGLTVVVVSGGGDASVPAGGTLTGLSLTPTQITVTMTTPHLTANFRVHLRLRVDAI